jgi:hypothetical protein
MAEAYANVLLSLMEQGAVDKTTLYGLGIVDKDGEITRFGILVLEKMGIEPEELLESISGAE